jgi:hypothetical protein
MKVFLNMSTERPLFIQCEATFFQLNLRYHINSVIYEVSEFFRSSFDVSEPARSGRRDSVVTYPLVQSTTSLIVSCLNSDKIVAVRVYVCVHPLTGRGA